MKRGLKPEEQALWRQVSATVRPLGAAPAAGAALMAMSLELQFAPESPSTAPAAPKTLEPRFARRLERERDPVRPRLDLHGLSQDAARGALMGFLVRAQADGWRAVMVITGRGLRGDGILRRRTPEWLAEPVLRDVVAGVAEAHRRHGGDGALYVALKRRKSA